MIKQLLWLAALILFFSASAQGQSASCPCPANAETLSSTLISAHRGGRDLKGYPENTLETFAYTLQRVPGAIIECDVNLSADSVLLLLHDATLDRTTNGKGPVQQQAWAALAQLWVKDDFDSLTAFRITRLDSLLAWSKGRACLTLDIKRGVPIEKVVEAVQQAGLSGCVSIITYNYEDALRVFQAEPRLAISVNIRNETELQRYLDGPFEPSRLMAFTGLTRRTDAFYQQVRAAGLMLIIGTIGNLDRSAAARGDALYAELAKAGAHILATDRPEAAYRALRSVEVD